MGQVARCPHCFTTVIARVGVRSRCPSCSGYFKIEAAHGRKVSRSRSAGDPQLLSQLEAMALRWTEVQGRIEEAHARGEDATPKIRPDGKLDILGTVIDLGQLSQLAKKARQSESAPARSSRSPRKGKIGDPPKYPQNSRWEIFDEEHEYQVIVYFPHHLDHEVKATVRDGLFIIKSLKYDAPNSFYYEFVLPEQVIPSSLRRVSNSSTFVFRFDKETLEASLTLKTQDA